MSSGTVQQIRTFKADLEAARQHSRTSINTAEIKNQVVDPTADTSNGAVADVSPLPKETETKNVKSAATEPTATAAAMEIPTTTSTTAPEEMVTRGLPKPALPDAKPIEIEQMIESSKPAEPTLAPDLEPTTVEPMQKLSPDHTEGEFAVETDNLDTGISEGTIVSNKKVGHYGLFRALGDNFANWQKTRAQKKVAVEAAKPKVTAAEARIETLKQAAKSSYRAPQSDHGILLKQLKKRKPPEGESATSNIVVKEKSEVPAPSWQHIVEEEKPTATEVVAEKKIPVVSETITTAPTKPTPAPTLAAEPTTPKPIPVYQWPTHKPNTPTVAPTIEDKEELPPAKEVRPSSTPKIIEAVQETIPEEVVKPNKKEPVAKQKDSATTTSNRLQFVLRLSVVGTFLLMVVGAVGGGVWYFFQTKGSPEYVEIATTPNQQLIRSDNDYTVSLSDGASKIYETIYNHMVESRNLTTHTFLNDNSEIAEAQIVTNTLAWRLSGSFARALTEITIGSIDGTEPFIILRAKNFDTAFAGMLAWESALSSDLSILFGEPVTESFDPSARTDTGLRPAFYADTIVSNTSVRILRDQNNTSRIIYGFANPNTIIITTDESAYGALLDRARN